jgi:membrane fusion protein, heavy metal efflux system
MSAPFKRPPAQIPASPLNPPELGDFRSSSPQNWGARGAKDHSCKRSNLFSNAVKAPRIAVILTSLVLLAAVPAIAHGGHGDEFEAGSQATQAAGSIQVDPKTADRIGLKVEPVSRQRLSFGIKTTGQIEALPNQQVEVTTPVKGTLLRLLVNPGDRVRAGQPVAIMTSPELAELRTTGLDRQAEAIAAVQQAEADLRLAHKNLVQQQKIVAADIRQARTEVNFSQERYDKDKLLMEQGAIARRQFLESQSLLAETKAALAKSESSLPISEAQTQLERVQSAVMVARSQMDLSQQTYRTRLQQLGAKPNPDGTIAITAPITGIVADREATQGESGEDAGKKILTIVNGSSVQASGNIYEKNLAQVQIGQQVRIRVSRLGDSRSAFEGRISVIGTVVEGAARVVPVKVQLKNPSGQLRPGMYVEMEVLTNRSAAGLAILKTAIVETNDKKQVVFVQNGTAFQPSEVTLGREFGDFVEVKSGLFEGDRVVTQRAAQLYAQSLRGGGTKAEKPEVSASPPQSQNSSVSWWLLVPVGGAIAATAFLAGRRSRDSMHPPVQTESAIDQTRNAEPSGLTESTETAESLHPPR